MLLGALTIACLQALTLMAQAHVNLGSKGDHSALPALNCIARLRSDVPDEGHAGVLCLLAFRANLQLDRWLPWV